MESGVASASSSQHSFDGRPGFSAVPRPRVDDAVGEDHARAEPQDDAFATSPCVPMSKFDGMHVMWLIVGLVSGSVLAPPDSRSRCD